MTRSDLIKTIAEKVDGVTQEKAKEIVAVTLDSIADALTAGDKVQFVGFGSFEVRERAGRTGRNPQDGSEIYIEPSKNVKFKAGKELKDNSTLSVMIFSIKFFRLYIPPSHVNAYPQHRLLYASIHVVNIGLPTRFPELSTKYISHTVASNIPIPTFGANCCTPSPINGLLFLW